MATKVNKDGKKPPTAATNLIGEHQLPPQSHMTRVLVGIRVVLTRRVASQLVEVRA